jgi:hypothetical protein
LLPDAAAISASLALVSSSFCILPPWRELLGGRKFAQAMPDHVLAHQYLYMLHAVVDAKFKANHFRSDLERRAHVLITAASELFALNLLEEFFVHVRTFFE